MKNIPKPSKKKSGVYKFANEKGQVIYIGSSKNLYERIRKYQKPNGKLKETLLYNQTKYVEYTYCDNYHDLELEMIKEFSPIHNKKSKEFKQPYLVKDKKYLDFYPVLQVINRFDICLIPSKKGIGKTIKLIREALISYLKNGKPSFYVRSTTIQLEEFVSDDKFISIVRIIGFLLPRDYVVSTKGLFKYTYDKKTKRKHKKPILYFLSINEAMKIQSSKYEIANYVIIDEIQNHFMSSGKQTFRKFINLMSSILREENTKIVILFNKVSSNDLFLQKFKVDQQIDSVKEGQVKLFTRTFGKDIHGNPVIIRIAVYNPKSSRALIESQNKSIANKLSYLDNYGKVINSNDFFIELDDIKIIKKYGDFEGIINFNGNKIGLWISKKEQHFQFSSKYNKNGKQYFIDIGDYSDNTNLISQGFTLKIKNKLLTREVEFDDNSTFGLIIEMLEAINLYKNNKGF